MMISIRNGVAFLAAALAVIISPVVSAHDAGRPILLEADYAAYRMQDDSARAYVEIFYHLPRGQLTFAPDTSGYLALIDFSIRVQDSTGTATDSAFWKAGCRIEKLSVLNDSYYLISDIIKEIFPTGRYRITMEAVSGDSRGSYSFDMTIPSFGYARLGLSALELAYEVTPDSASKFSKAGYRILPNPSGRFSQDKNVVYIYTEGYNLDVSPGADSMYTVIIDILDSAGNIVRSLPPSDYKKPGPSAVIITGFSTATLARADYIVRFTLQDGEDKALEEKKFAVSATPERLRQELLQASLNEFPEANKINSEEDAARFKDDIVYIARIDELKLYNSLNLQGKSSFQMDFWQGRDPDMGTPENEFKLEHYRRIKYADEHFGQYKGYIRGWQTDMGRIYIVYGDPSEIERNHSTIENRAWERWWYHGIEGGVYFIFVDFEDTGAFKLVHSSKRDEIKDYNWEDKVKMTLFQR